MRWLVMFGFLFVALSYISEAEAVREMSDDETRGREAPFSHKEDI